MRMRKGLAKIIFSLVFDGIYKVFSYFCRELEQKKLKTSSLGSFTRRFAPKGQKNLITSKPQNLKNLTTS